MNAFGFGRSELSEGGLQAAIIQQCDLHGVVDAKRPAQKLLHAGVDLGGIRVGLNARDVLAEFRRGDGLNRAHASVRRKARATAQKHH